ncbi:cobalamin biosynthesis protein, partial [Loktanella salsilacus]|uniref:cobalamin biosynthesis protein n=1 Tax=Loktanella salsilacus TaxID=195913 RepID=UPI003569BAAC
MTLIFGLLLDAMFGEPRWLWSRIPHPAVMMGACVAWIDRRANNGANRRAKGVIAFGLLALAFVLLGFVLAAIPGHAVDIIVLAIPLINPDGGEVRRRTNEMGFDMGGAGPALRTACSCVGMARCENACYDTHKANRQLVNAFLDDMHRP